MTTWNVLTGVVQLVEAETAKEAERIVTTEYAESVKATVRTEATWYAIGYAAGRNTAITHDAAERFADSYADLYAEWLTRGDVESYPGLRVSLTEWLAKQ